jgi:membrane-bound metal-dependent hydrolase YbcI (DUF457 family)
MKPDPSAAARHRTAAHALLLFLLATCAALWLLGVTTLKTAAGIFCVLLAVIAALGFVDATASATRKDAGGPP